MGSSDSGLSSSGFGFVQASALLESPKVIDSSLLVLPFDTCSGEVIGSSSSISAGFGSSKAVGTLEKMLELVLVLKLLQRMLPLPRLALILPRLLVLLLWLSLLLLALEKMLELVPDLQLIQRLLLLLVLVLQVLVLSHVQRVVIFIVLMLQELVLSQDQRLLRFFVLCSDAPRNGSGSRSGIVVTRSGVPRNRSRSKSWPRATTPDFSRNHSNAFVSLFYPDQLISWAQVCSNNVKVADDAKLSFKPPVLINGRKTVVIPKAIISRNIEVWNNSIICYSLGQRIDPRGFEKFISMNWNLRAPFRLFGRA